MKKIIIKIILFILFLWGLYFFHCNIINFLMNPNAFLKEVSFKEVFIAIGAIITISLTFWRSDVYYQTLKNQNNIQENEEKTKNNQQFLDSIKLFENDNLDLKIAGLYNLENLALSNPEYRQRVLYFLNSLNIWVRTYNYKDFNCLKIKEIRDKKNPLVSSTKVSINQQLLSVETSRIFEQIIKKTNSEWDKFTKEEQDQYSLNLTNCIFFNINLSNEIFPYPVNFSKSIFLGQSNFENCTFKKDLKCTNSEFIDTAYFLDSNFQENTDFSLSEFNNKTNFNGSLFNKKLNFFSCTLKSRISFTNSKKQKSVIFKGSVSFELCNNQLKNFSFIDFNNSYFLGNINLERSNFSELTLQKVTVKGTSNFYKIKSKKICISNSTFHSNVDLRNDLYSYDLYAINTKFLTSIDFTDLEIIKSNFEGAYFKYPNFTRVSFQKKTNFKNVDFSKNNISNILTKSTYEKIKEEGGTFSKKQELYFSTMSKEKKKEILKNI